MSTTDRYGRPPSGSDDPPEDEWEEAPRPASRSSSTYGTQPYSTGGTQPIRPAPGASSGYPELQRYLEEEPPRPGRQGSTSRSTQPRQPGYDPGYVSPPRSAGVPGFEDDWAAGDVDAAYPDATSRSGAARVPPAARTASRQRGVKPTSSFSVAVPEVSDRIALAAMAASLLGLMFMVVTLASQSGDLPDWIPLKLDASGDTSLWGTPGSLWSIPFGVFMMITMSAVLAFLISRRDQFTARVVAVATVMVQVIAWIALVDHLW